ncbi:hypothetical protein [Solitalea canadensis]|nr:hypothetical protein [Solitalea canadensis]
MKFCKNIIFIWILLIFPFAAIAHIGSPGILFEGMAGKYKVIVNVMPPDVIPGTAQISVLVESGNTTKVTVQPIYLYAGAEGAPDADTAIPAPNVPGNYQGLIWLMENGVASVRVSVYGDQGIGEVVVPIMAVPTAQKDMPANLGWILAGLGSFLVILMITIIGASVSDGVTAPGNEMSGLRRRKRWVSMAVTTVVLGLILFGGSSWWNNWAQDYKRYMFKPFTASSSIKNIRGNELLEFKVDTASLEGRWMSLLIPDHGKLMHLFLVREGSLDIFAHLHPKRIDSITFESPLPALPKGRYLIFADIVRRGFASTIVDTIDVEQPFSGTTIGLSRDDSYLFSNAVAGKKALMDSAFTVCGTPGIKTVLADGSSMTLESTSGLKFKNGEISKLSFMVLDPEGNPAQLEPYLGMGGHAVVVKNDAKVYIHLHPTGTFSAASAQLIENRIEKKTGYTPQPDAKHFKDSIDALVNRLDNMSESVRNEYLMQEMNMSGANPSHKAHEGAVVDFPYVFPFAGDYRIWVQVKRAGKVLSAAFDVKVQ